MSYVAGGGGEGAKKSILILVCEIKKKKLKKICTNRHTSLHSVTFIVWVYYSNIYLTRQLR